MNSKKAGYMLWTALLWAALVQLFKRFTGRQPQPDARDVAEDCGKGLLFGVVTIEALDWLFEDGI